MSFEDLKAKQAEVLKSWCTELKDKSIMSRMERAFIFMLAK